MKKIFFLLFAAILPAMSPEASAQSGGFPFFRSFQDGVLTDIAFPPPYNNAGASRVNSAKLDETTRKGLVLTRGLQEVGAFYLPNHPFTTQEGMLIEFEYIMMYTNPGATSQTDGISIFLVDNKPEYVGANMKFGAQGAGFGYTHRAAINSVDRIVGIKGGYLAVAIDQGNFKNVRMEGYEMRNGIEYTNTPNAGAAPLRYDMGSNITIRGAAGNGTKYINSKYPDQPEAYWGYPVLITRHTGGRSGQPGVEDPNTPGMRNEAGFMLNTTDGNFVQQVSPVIDKPFNIAGGGEFTYPDEPEYRKAIIALEPNKTGGGFKITVTVQHGEEKTVVIKDFTYPSTLKYPENGLPFQMAGDVPVPYANPPIVEYTVPTPDELVVGFAASTGINTSYTNIIRNLRITLLYGAESENDLIYDHRRGPVTVKLLENDLAYQDVGGVPTPGKANLDPTSVRFWENENIFLGEGTAGFEHTVAKGKWVYDPEVGEMMFFPNKGATGEVSIMYDVKGKHLPYSDERYRSSKATISVNIDDNQP